jgi:hypothetical protein
VEAGIERLKEQSPLGQKLFPLNEEEGNSFPLGQNWLKGIISFFFMPIAALQSP